MWACIFFPFYFFFELVTNHFINERINTQQEHQTLKKNQNTNHNPKNYSSNTTTTPLFSNWEMNILNLNYKKKKTNKHKFRYRQEKSALQGHLLLRQSFTLLKCKMPLELQLARLSLWIAWLCWIAAIPFKWWSYVTLQWRWLHPSVEYQSAIQATPVYD